MDESKLRPSDEEALAEKEYEAAKLLNRKVIVEKVETEAKAEVKAKSIKKEVKRKGK